MNSPLFPVNRLRRLRKSSAIREVVAETQLSKSDLIMPLFVHEGENLETPIKSLPGQSRLSIDLLVKKCQVLHDNGILAVLLFGIPDEKDDHGHIAARENGIIQRAIKSIKKEVPGLIVIADVCNCEYTTHGHCGTIIEGEVDNDLTLVTLVQQSISLAKAGADIIAPSDMMDGRVKVIREGLDKSGYIDIPIMPYSAKYSSSFYGPFREAAGSTPGFGNRKSYQMDYRNSDEALREIKADIEEGADMVIIKPGISYLDIILRAKQNFNIPVIAYNVSGEYAMVKAAAQNGWINEEETVLEMLYSFKRAGADLIITYWAEQVIENFLVST